MYSDSDFAQLDIELNPEMQRSISAFETLAQIALFSVTSNFFLHIACLKSLSDNSGAESESNKLLEHRLSFIHLSQKNVSFVSNVGH